MVWSLTRCSWAGPRESFSRHPQLSPQLRGHSGAPERETKPNQTKPNQTKPNQTKPNQTKLHPTSPWQRTRDMKLEQLGYGPERVPKPIGLTATMAFIAGGLLVVWSTYIHFHLWRNLGYRPIPTIGTLFLVQSIAGLLVGLLIIFVRRVWVAIVGVGFALSTMIGFLASINYGRS